MQDASARLTPATFEQWMEALDRYPKTVRELRDTEGFCCLGVLADIEGACWQPGTDIATYRTVLNEAGNDDDGGTTGLWSGLIGGELREFLSFEAYWDWDGAECQVVDVLASINDESDTFEPVKAKARELYAQWKAAQA